jgi:hypothetical protein
VIAALVAVASTFAASHASTPQACATIAGPTWTQTINVTANRPPPKTAKLRQISGSHYDVFVDHLACTWAKSRVRGLLRLRASAEVRASAPSGYLCSVGSTHWYRDVHNGDTVRRSAPLVSVGVCSTQETDAVPGVTYPTFWWTPAKPCRLDFVTDVCRR